MIVKIIKNLENRKEKMQESVNKDLEELKTKHTETNNTIIEIKNTLEGITSRISEADEWISELEDKMVEITSEEQNKVKRMKRTEDSLRDFWDNIKCSNWQYQYSNYSGPRRREKERVWEIFWRDFSGNFLNMEKEIVNQVQEAQKSPILDEPNEKHAKTHTNQTNKD